MDPLHILYIVNIGFIGIIFLIHLRFTKNNYAANRFLSLFFFTLAYASLMLVLFSTKWILKSPHFYRTGNFFIYMTFPAAYLYMRKMIKQEGWQRSDLVHLAPAFLYLIDFAPFLLSSTQEKLSVLQADLEAGTIYTFKLSWFLPTYFHLFFRTALAFVYLFLMGRLWQDNFSSRAEQSFKKENKALGHWFAILIILLFVAALPTGLLSVMGTKIDNVKIANASAYFITTGFAFFLLFKPEIIYGVKGLWLDPDNSIAPANLGQGVVKETAQDDKPQDSTEIKRVYLTKEQVETMGKKIETHMVGTQSYLKPGYSIGELSIAVKSPIPQISAYLNNYKEMNFNEYINSCRIRHLLDKLDKAPELERFTLEALGQTVGFNSRQTFMKAFKKYTGETPSVYLKRRIH